MAQASKGRIEIFEDFIGGEDIVANTAATRTFGTAGLRVIGQGIAETDSGIVLLESDGLNGVGRLTTTNEDAHSIGLTTATMFDVGKMGTIVLEARVQFENLDTKEFYFGLTDVNADATILEGGTLVGNGTTMTLTASDLCGFYLSAELTDDEDFHAVFNGGTTTGETVSTSLDLDDDAVAGEWDVLRLEVGNNGTARWFVNGVLKKTQAGAVSTSTDLAALLMVATYGAAIETVDVDYIHITANRDWTV
tara:strand:- start:6328 stop:7077 length:750 start_codon:yes stop_codon:yes gene_type:complete